MSYNKVHYVDRGGMNCWFRNKRLCVMFHKTKTKKEGYDRQIKIKNVMTVYLVERRPLFVALRIETSTATASRKGEVVQ